MGEGKVKGKRRKGKFSGKGIVIVKVVESGVCVKQHVCRGGLCRFL